MIDSPFTGLFTASGRAPRAPGDPDVALWSATLLSGLEVGGAGWSEEAAREAAAPSASASVRSSGCMSERPM